MTHMERDALEIQMQNLDPKKLDSMKEYMDKLQDLHQDIMQVGKTISSKDVAILLM